MLEHMPESCIGQLWELNKKTGQTLTQQASGFWCDKPQFTGRLPLSLPLDLLRQGDPQ